MIAYRFCGVSGLRVTFGTGEFRTSGVVFDVQLSCNRLIAVVFVSSEEHMCIRAMLVGVVRFVVCWFVVCADDVQHKGFVFSKFSAVCCCNLLMRVLLLAQVIACSVAWAPEVQQLCDIVFITFLVAINFIGWCSVVLTRSSVILVSRLVCCVHVAQHERYLFLIVSGLLSVHSCISAYVTFAWGHIRPFFPVDQCVASLQQRLARCLTGFRHCW